MTYWVSQSSIWGMLGDEDDERTLRVLLERAAASINLPNSLGMDGMTTIDGYRRDVGSCYSTIAARSLQPRVV
jgi:hypothetical protein